MAFLASNIANEVGLRLLLCPLGSNIVVRTACCSVGIAFPVYSTIKAIETKDQNEQHKWLLYWAAYGTFSLAEVFTDKLLFPMYYHMKFAFLVWLQLPSVDGAKQLYRSHLRPFFLRHQARVDQAIGFTYNEMLKFMSSHQEEIQFCKAVIVKSATSVEELFRGTTRSVGDQERRAIDGPVSTNPRDESDNED
ncbi:TB2/DP1/HVA22-related protein [Dillenia turbinata]|uniref:HVA22-like protein n=1 Tax=Dillenia turbinata TaxID=194707 RepID=A0AAN8V6B6_9MAGN